MKRSLFLIVLLAVATLAGAQEKTLTCNLTIGFGGGAPPAPSRLKLVLDESAGSAKLESDIWSAHTEVDGTLMTWTTFDFFANEFSMTLDRKTGVLLREEVGQGSTTWKCR